MQRYIFTIGTVLNCNVDMKRNNDINFNHLMLYCIMIYTVLQDMADIAYIIVIHLSINKNEK